MEDTMKIAYFTRNNYDTLRWEWEWLGCGNRRALFITTPLFTCAFRFGY